MTALPCNPTAHQCNALKADRCKVCNLCSACAAEVVRNGITCAACLPDAAEALARTIVALELALAGQAYDNAQAVEELRTHWEQQLATQAADYEDLLVHQPSPCHSCELAIHAGAKQCSWPVIIPVHPNLETKYDYSDS